MALYSGGEIHIWNDGNRGPWNFLSWGSERIYFSSSPQGRWKVLVRDKPVRHKRDLFERKINQDLVPNWMWGMKGKTPFRAWIKAVSSRRSASSFFSLGSRQSQLWLQNWIIQKSWQNTDWFNVSGPNFSIPKKLPGEANAAGPGINHTLRCKVLE